MPGSSLSSLWWFIYGSFNFVSISMKNVLQCWLLNAPSLLQRDISRHCTRCGLGWCQCFLDTSQAVRHKMLNVFIFKNWNHCVAHVNGTKMSPASIWGVEASILRWTMRLLAPVLQAPFLCEARITISKALNKWIRGRKNVPYAGERSNDLVLWVKLVHSFHEIDSNVC